MISMLESLSAKAIDIICWFDICLHVKHPAADIAFCEHLFLRLVFNTLNFTTRKTWHWGYYAVLHRQSLRWYGMHSMLSPVSYLSQTFWFPALEGGEGLKIHGLKVWRLMSVFVAWQPLTRKAEMHGELAFDIAWCCQPHRMGHKQHPDLKLDMDGWMDYWTKDRKITSINLIMTLKNFKCH